MSTRRARKHKECTHIERLVREHVNETNRGGLFDKRFNKVTCRPYKFRKRVYYRENDLEGKILDKKLQRPLKTDPLGLLQVKPADWQQESYPELAQNLYKTGPVSVDFSLNPEFAQKLLEALKDD